MGRVPSSLSVSIGNCGDVTLSGACFTVKVKDVSSGGEGRAVLSPPRFCPLFIFCRGATANLPNPQVAPKARIVDYPGRSAAQNGSNHVWHCMICMILVPFWSPASVCNREPVCSLLELTNRYERRELSNIA